MKNSYYGLADEDLKFAKAGIGLDFYNNIAVLCHQASEKFLKAIIEEKGFNNINGIDIMRTHNLKGLYKCIKENLESAKLDFSDCSFLTTYYYDARYPGYNFIEVSKEEAIKCLDIAEEIKKETDRILGV